MDPEFAIVLRGYDRRQVDQLMTEAAAAVVSGSAEARSAAREALRTAQFTMSLRGYDRGEVDRAVVLWLDELA